MPPASTRTRPSPGSPTARRRRATGWLALALVSTACAGAGDAGDDDNADSGSTAAPADTSGDAHTDTAPGGSATDGDVAQRPNWHEDIAPLVAEHCRGCHEAGGLAFPMETYAQTESWASVMAVYTASGEMPPWHAVETEECTPPLPFEHDARLSDTQKQRFQDWADLGAPEGDPALAAPIPTPPSLQLGDPSATMQMGGSITVDGSEGILDRFHCLSFDPGNTQDVYVDAMQVIQGNAAILHHVLIFFDEDAESGAWPQGIDEDCGSGPGVGNAQLIGAWVPGSRPIEAPEGIGIPLRAGARIVFNVHYHASVLGAESDDTTGLALRWGTDVPEWVSLFALVGAPGQGESTTGAFVIPAGARGHEEVIEWALPQVGNAEARLWSVGHHMHKVAVDAKTSILRDGAELCMVQTPRWDYGWQRLYEFDVPVDDSFALQPGDQVRVRCTYDNSLENPELAGALAEQGFDAPQDVYVGEGTLDEMCLAGIAVAVRQ